MQRLRFFPEFERHSQVVELGTGDDARAFSVISEWSRKESAWFLSFFEADGTAIAENVRVSPGNIMIPDMDRLSATKPKTAFILALGPEPYGQLDLGVTVKVFHALYSELDAPVGDGTVFSV